MSLQDPISDMILRIKNAQARGHSKVSFGSSKLKQAICEVLSDEGFIKKVEVIKEDIDTVHKSKRIICKNQWFSWLRTLKIKL